MQRIDLSADRWSRVLVFLGNKMKRKADYKMQRIGGEHLLVPLGGEVTVLNGFVTLNETAAWIWEMLAEERSLNELTVAVAERFDVGPGIAFYDVKNFVGQIDGLGLLEP